MSRVVDALTAPRDSKQGIDGASRARQRPLNADTVFNEIDGSKTSLGTMGGTDVHRIISGYASNTFTGVVTRQIL